MSVCARDLARKNNWITIWDVWPCYLYNHLNHDDNPLRCIHAEDSEREAFFGNMSQAFARMARESGRVLHSDANFERPPGDGIWAKVEFPALQQGGVVEFLEKINENKSLSEIFWRRPRDFVVGLWGSLTAQDGLGHSDLRRRESSGSFQPAGPPPLPPGFHGTCMSPRELDFFEKVHW